MNSAPTIECPKCHSGQLKLQGPLLRTYQAIVDMGSPTVPEIAEHLNEKLHPTAVNRRVERLMQMQLIRARFKKHDGVRYFVK